jgi:hypothetical protein
VTPSRAGGILLIWTAEKASELEIQLTGSRVSYVVEHFGSQSEALSDEFEVTAVHPSFATVIQSFFIRKPDDSQRVA